MTNPAFYLVIGVLIVLAAWMPLFVQRTPLSMPMIAVGVGALFPVIADVGDPYATHSSFMQHLSEFGLVVSVLAAGLKIDRRFSLAAWASTWRLLFLTMVLSIFAIAIAAHFLLGLSAGVAIVLGAVLAPTDPVLASGIGAGPPGVGEEGEMRFALTSEAGLNDGMAFPFVALGLAFVGGSIGTPGDLMDWAMIDLVWDVAGGVVLGIAFGWALVRINDALAPRFRLPSSNSGLVSVGLAFMAYGMASVIHGNGFVAVFCEAAAIRYFASTFEYSQRLNHAAEQFERVAMVGVLMLLGVSVASGLFTQIGLAEVAFAVFVLVVVRPVAVQLSFIGSRHDRLVRAALSYFGIRGIASLFYVSYVGSDLPTADARTITTVVGLVILMSVVLYGTTTGFVESALSGDQSRDP